MGCRKVRLGDVCEEVRERISSNNVALEDYITTDNMLKNRGGCVCAASVPPNTSLVKYRMGDVLISNIRPYLKKIGIMAHDGACSNDVIAYRAKAPELLPEYLYTALSQDRFFDYVMENVSGTKMPRGRRDWIRKFEFPLPPLSEQRKIATSVDKAMKRVDAIERQFEKLRSVADEYLLSAMAVAFPSSSDKKVLADVCKSVSVGIVVRPTRYYVKEGLRAFRNTNIRPNSVRDADWICVDRRAIVENPRCEVKRGDVVVARSGLPGVAAVVESRHDGYAAIDILILKPDPDSVDSHYLAYYINTPHSQALIKRMNNGVAQSHVGLTSLAKLSVSVPALREQRRIVVALDAARTRAGEFDALAARGLANCARMRKAILAEAFAV